MEAKLTDLESKLSQQLAALAEQIRASESALLTLKEGYLKVTGALEAVAILKKDKESEE